MRKYKLVLICFVLLCALSVGAGVIFKSRYKTYDKAYLETNLATDVVLVNAIDEFYQNQARYDAGAILNNDVYKAVIIDKKIYGDSVVAVAQIEKTYAGNKQAGDIIEIMENVRLNMLDGMTFRSNDYLDPGLVNGDEYILVLQPSQYAKGMYDLAYKDFSYLRIAEGYVDSYVGMYQSLLPFDENGHTYLYYVDPEMDVSVVESYYGPGSMEGIVSKLNAAGQAMYAKLIELANS